jgi:hypothetical protein
MRHQKRPASPCPVDAFKSTIRPYFTRLKYIQNMIPGVPSKADRQAKALFAFSGAKQQFRGRDFPCGTPT